MNIIEDIKPISFLKQKTNEVIEHIKNTKRPTFITINGNVEFVIQDAKTYQEMIDNSNKNDSYVFTKEDIAKIEQGLKEVEDGKFIPVEEAFKIIENNLNS